MSILTNGFSDAARFVNTSLRRGEEHLRETETFGLDSELREEFATVWAECREANWDGYQAFPISQETLRYAYELLESMPIGIQSPSIGAEPDGQITLEWHLLPRRTLSVSVSPEGELHYAALLGPNRVYGTEVFFGQWPRTIVELVNRVYGR